MKRFILKAQSQTGQTSPSILNDVWSTQAGKLCSPLPPQLHTPVSPPPLTHSSQCAPACRCVTSFSLLRRIGATRLCLKVIVKVRSSPHLSASVCEGAVGCSGLFRLGFSTLVAYICSTVSWPLYFLQSHFFFNERDPWPPPSVDHCLPLKSLGDVVRYVPLFRLRHKC